ncbi:NAD(P)H-dependent oxidoreductase [Haploplasma axanthum]|uniref:NADPH-quinone reductase (Modulator of drug activity B) n=1 Tax=Haploplasma axanthum TaxID=29552 RepID=A0A449BDM9_HAPAX|nr:NAD(P)H-dependent oxidoreductase [Haploplasma axanthum]VEU80561.1 Putative NADPH-quinone reductase (modulator of drug activity B) [Haploplasma axanthum]
MKTLVVYAHPWDGSFNHFVLDKVSELLENQGKTVDVIDLNKDGFDPVMHPADLKVFARGEYHDELAKSYVEKLKAADELVFVFPIWWYGEPAILKGFYDKVLLKGQVYHEVDHQMKGLLNTKKATIITTANIDKTIFSYLGDPIKNVLAGGILKTIGVENCDWIHCPTVHVEEARNKFLSEIEQNFA